MTGIRLAPRLSGHHVNTSARSALCGTSGHWPNARATVFNGTRKKNAPVAIIVLVGSQQEMEAGKGRVGLTAGQAAVRLNIGERTFRQLIEDGEISPYEEQLGPMKFFEEPDVEELRKKRLRRY